MEKRPRRTPAEKARAQYTNYAVKEPMELMEFLAVIKHFKKLKKLSD